MLKDIYYCLVYSHLSYGVEAWGSACKSDLEKLLILQKKAVRILTDSQYYRVYNEPAGSLPHSDPLFKKTGILKFGDIFKLNIAKFVYSTLCGDSPAVFSGWFVPMMSILLRRTRIRGRKSSKLF